jgi:1,4-dihydroxy-2-naphthoyl-CoA synthase
LGAGLGTNDAPTSTAAQIRREGNPMDEALYERKGAGAWLSLNRPEQLNALNPAMMSQLAHHIDRARADNEVRALVITRPFSDSRIDRRVDSLAVCVADL